MQCLGGSRYENLTHTHGVTRLLGEPTHQSFGGWLVAMQHQKQLFHHLWFPTSTE